MLKALNFLIKKKAETLNVSAKKECLLKLVFFTPYL